MDEVLPVANELDPQKGEIPRVAARRDRRAGLLRHHRARGVRRPRARCLRVLHGGRGAGPRLDERRQHHRPRAGRSGRASPTRHDAASCCARSARGEWIGAIALSEPDAGSDLAGVATRAVRDGDEWVVTGQKRWSGNAKAADFIQVLVRDRDPGPGESPLGGPGEPRSLEKERGAFPDGADRLSHRQDRLPRLPDLGPRRSTACGCPVGDASTSRRRTSERGPARRHAEAQWLNIARVHTAARAVGLARAAVEDCIALPAGARAVRAPDRRLPGGPVHAGRRWPPRSSRRGRSTSRSPTCSTSAQPCEREAAMVKLLATEMAAAGDRRRRSSCTAATATRPSTRSSGTGATPG